MDGKVDHLLRHIIGILQEGGFQIKSKDIGDGLERRYNSSKTTPVEAVDSPLMASGISTAASASTSSCASKKRGMHQMTNYKGSQLKLLKAFYEPARLSDLEHHQMNLALLHAMIAGGVPFNFVETYDFQEFMKIIKPSFKIPSQKHMTDHYLVKLYSKIPSPVMQFRNAEHFMMNDCMLELVTLVADLIGYLEKTETNIANIAV